MTTSSLICLNASGWFTAKSSSCDSYPTIIGLEPTPKVRNWLNESSEEVSIQPDLAKMEAMVLPARATESTMAGCPPLSTVARSAAFSLPEFDFTGSVESMRNCP